MRDPDKYGSLSLLSIQKFLESEFPQHILEFFQSNVEGEIVEQIQKASGRFDALVINPAGYSHTSVVIRDALELCNIPKIEVHLSNLVSREDFRQKLLTASVCDGYISGFKELGYFAAIKLVEKILS